LLIVRSPRITTPVRRLLRLASRSPLQRGAVRGDSPV